MVSVDDLVISLRIDETSNLGKLQKQLTALIGPKGEKAAKLGVGVTPDLRNTLNEIKRRMMVLTPTVLADKEQVQAGALALATDIKRNKELRELILSRYKGKEEVIDEFVEELFNIASDISELNNDQQKRFVSEIDKFRQIATMEKGERDTLMSKLLKMLLEAKIMQGRVMDIFSAAGIKAYSQYYVYELNKSSVGEAFTDAIKKFKEEDPVKFEKLKDIFDKTTDTLQATTDVYFEETGKILDITRISREDAALQKIILAQVAASLEGTQWMLEDLVKVAKLLFTRGRGFAVRGAKKLDVIVHGITAQALKDIGMEKIYGELDETRKNILLELKTEAGKDKLDEEMWKRLVKEGYDHMVIVAKRFTKPGLDHVKALLNKPEFKGKTVSLWQLTTRLTEEILGIAKNLDDAERDARAKDKQRQLDAKQTDELDEKKEQEIRDMEQMFAGLDDLTPEGGLGGPTVDEAEKLRLAEERHRKIAEKIDETKEVVDNTNKKVNEVKDPNETIPREEEEK